MSHDLIENCSLFWCFSAGKSRVEWNRYYNNTGEKMKGSPICRHTPSLLMLSHYRSKKVWIRVGQLGSGLIILAHSYSRMVLEWHFLVWEHTSEDRAGEKFSEEWRKSVEVGVLSSNNICFWKVDAFRILKVSFMGATK